tara:strand:- start:3431 stop:3898 length:468 start_codon:yes stop_codon:yes gene_type:complete
MNRSAVFSSCRKYRYSLTRSWGLEKNFILFIGLNPSIADENNDDPTISRCISFAKDWGYDGLIMVNLFAFRASLPSNLKKEKLPIGVDNNRHILKNLKTSQLIVVAWGNDGQLLKRDREVLGLIKNPMCLKINKTKQPAHPLYQKKSQQLIKYSY